MSSYKWIGPGLSAAEQVNATIEIDKLGVISASLEFTISYDSAVTYAMNKVKHPDFPWLVRSSATVTREEANLARVRVTYKGISPEYAEGVQRTYSLEGTLSTEPIETHPNFRTFAGTPAEPKPGAIFDDDGKFTGFAADIESESDNPFDMDRRKAGVRSFLSPSVILTETIVRSYKSTNGYDPASPQALTGLGCIDDPPDTPIKPSVHDKRNWLLIGTTVEDLGNGTRETRRWRLSGPRGWDRDIYAQSSVNR